MKTLTLAPYLQRFFTERLGAQMKASPNTIISYRDTFRLLLKHAATALEREPTELKVTVTRFGDLRLSTLSWCRRIRISACNATRDRNSPAMAHQISPQRSPIGPIINRFAR
jgi:hypothetical protein